MESEGTRSYPQPYEGVSRSARTEDDLLSLEDEAIPRRMIMAGMADCLYRAVLVGNPAPVVERMCARIRKPQPGDVVLVTDSLRRDEDTRIKGFGVLLARRVEWCQSDADLAAEIARMRAEGFAGEEYIAALESGAERSAEEAWYVKYGPAADDICRWLNCSVIAVLSDRREFDVPVGTRDGNGVTFTRGDLLGGLADSGFHLKPQAAGGG